MNKKILVLPLIAILGLSACKSGGNSGDSIEKVTYERILKNSEIKSFYLTAMSAASKFVSYSFEEERFTAETSSIAESKITEKREGVIYSNYWSPCVTTTTTESTKSGITTSDESVHTETFGIVGKNKISVDERSSNNSITSSYSISPIVNPADEQFKKELITYYPQCAGDAIYFLSSPNSSAVVGVLKNGDIEYRKTSESENYNYIDKGDTKEEHTYSASQEVCTFAATGEIKSYSYYSVSKSTLNPLTGEFLDKMMTVSETSAKASYKYGERESAPVSDVLNQKYFIKGNITAKGKSGYVEDPAEATSSAFINAAVAIEQDKTKPMSGKARFTLDMSNAFLPTITLNYTVETINSEEGGSTTEALTHELNLVSAAPTLVRTNSDGTLSFLYNKSGATLMFEFDYFMDLEGKLNTSNLTLVNSWLR